MVSDKAEGPSSFSTAGVGVPKLEREDAPGGVRDSSEPRKPDSAPEALEVELPAGSSAKEVRTGIIFAGGSETGGLLEASNANAEGELEAVSGGEA